MKDLSPAILVCLHIYYHDQTDYFLSRLSNISRNWTLIVTWSTPDDSTRKKILSFKPDAIFMEVENAGYDIWPFIKAVESVDLKRFEYIIKLHTKSCTNGKARINGRWYSGYEWRNELVDSLLGSRESFEKMDSIFADKKVGMVCSAKLYSTGDFIEDLEMLDLELSKLGFTQVDERRFCYGTMMALRSSVLQRLQDFEFSADYFGSICVSHTGGTKAHVYERVLSILPVAQGFEIRTVGAGTTFRIKQVYRKIIERIFKWIFTIDRDSVTARKYLVFFGFRINL